MKGIEGKVHVITGGYGGIAMATARYLLSLGGIVVLTGRDASKGAVAVAELKKSGGAAHFFELDQADEQGTIRVAKEIEANVGPVHGLVVNAAYAFIAPTIDHSSEEWRKVMAVNLDGAFYCIKAFGAAMRGRGGSIVLISSIASRTAVGPNIAYNASKAGLSHFAEVLGVEWARDGVRVNALEPGFTATYAIEHITREAPDVAAGLQAQIPMGRFLRPEEIAHPVSFLLSDLSSGMTGSIVIVDGGMSAK